MFIKSTVVALLASFVAAQSNYTVVPSSIDLSTRASWCAGQISTCGTLCDGLASPNDCAETTLTFNCKCTANGTAPGLRYYTQTLPTFLCEEQYRLCTAANENNQAGQRRCDQTRADECGKLNPADFVPTSSTSSSAGPTATPTTSAGGATVAPQASSSRSSSSAAAATMGPSRDFGAGVLVAGAAAAFGLIL